MDVTTGDAYSFVEGAFAALIAAEPTSVTVATDAGTETYRLKAGELYRVGRDDLHIGSAITADHPIGVFVGAPLAFIPYNVAFANQILTQIPPTGAWATEYAVTGHPQRRPGKKDDPSLFRIVAAKAGTTFEYDPSPPLGAPASLDAGGLAVFGSSTPFVVRSQDAEHPFYVSVSMFEPSVRRSSLRRRAMGRWRAGRHPVHGLPRWTDRRGHPTTLGVRGALRVQRGLSIRRYPSRARSKEDGRSVRRCAARLCGNAERMVADWQGRCLRDGDDPALTR